MPLLHRKPFVRQKPPADLQPDEEVFLCKITHEIFRTYDEFFERTILCNSLVWSCALTGRSGLTYLEAVESEQRARLSLQNYPPNLLLPLLHLATLSNRCRLSELCEDVYVFVKDRFFPGEMVDVTVRNGTRQACEILQVIPPKGSLVANGRTKSTDHDTIVISDSDDEHDEFLSSPVMVNGKKKKPLNPSAFKYSVKMNNLSETVTVGAKQITRKKSLMSRERLKLLFKQHCECVNGMVAVKPSTVVKYSLSEQTFTHFFPEEPPLFPSKPMSSGSPGQSRLAAEEKMRLLQHREQMAAAGHQRAQLKKGKEDARRKEKEDKEKQKEEQRRCFEEEKQKKREEQRRWFEEEKQKRREDKERRKLEKEREREKLKEEKRKYAERLKLWNKPREDLECEDLKELPSPSPVKTRLPAEHFGEALMVLEFLQAFGDVFDLKDEFPEGVSLETLEEALVGSDPEGPLCEMLFFFLSAIFQALDEEREEVAREAEEILEPLDDNTNPTDSALSAVASLAAAWPQLHQGSTLKQLDLDSCTLTEILRLHILASGADCNLGNANFRYRKQGGFTLMDDPCVQLRLSEPALMKRLSSSAVYDLSPGEKLRILQALIGKLLTLASSRDLIEDCVEDQRAAKQELREIRSEQHRREREEAAYRVRLRKEERLREQEQRMKEKEEKLKEQERNGKAQTSGNADEAEQLNLSNITQEKVEQHPSDSGTGLCPPSSLTPEELEAEQEKVRELLERVQKAASCTCLLPLGRDRMYRRYWLLPSASALFVEEDSFGLTEDMLQPRPKPAMDTTAEMEDGDLPKDEVAEGSAGSSPAPQHSHSPPVNRPNQWSFYSSLEEVDQLIEALNPRGHRESSLREALLQERDHLQQLLPSCDRSKYRHSDDPESSRSVPECTAAAETVMERRLCDLLLDIEDRVHQGSLGTLKVMDRQLWRSALEAGSYERLCSVRQQLGQDDVMEVDGHVMAKDSVAPGSGSTTPLVLNSVVGPLAQALTHIEHGIERRFLKAPLGDDDSKKEVKKKSNKKKDDGLSDDAGDCSRVVKTVLDRWRESLLSCSSLSQVFVHLSTLERSIIWARSILNARCRICRRKGDADNMLLCDGCDRGHHTHCLRPRLKVIPVGDWFCPDCRPKQRSSHFSSRKRTYVEEDEEGMNEDEEVEEEDESEEEEESEDYDDEESVEERVVTRKGQAPPSKSKSRPAPPTKGKSQPTPPPPKGKGQNGTPKSKKAADFKTPPARSSGKKTPPSKASSSSSKAPTRSSTRNSTSNQGFQVPASNTPDNQDSRKRTGKDDSPPSNRPKPVLPSSSSSSSSRRSSGRNHGVHELSACEQLIVDLVRHDDSWPFMKLVSRTQVPDYYDIITKPIALSIIREKVNNCEYQAAEEFVSDVDLMFSNCLQYNPRHTNEAKAGQRLQQFFHSQLNRLGLSGHDKTPPPAKRSRN